jgi:hypothetical protein
VLPKSVKRLGVTAVVAGAALMASVLPAVAADGVPGQRMTLCSPASYYLPGDPGQIAQLPVGTDVLVDQVQGAWVAGFAFGSVNRDIWLMDGHFC